MQPAMMKVVLLQRRRHRLNAVYFTNPIVAYGFLKKWMKRKCKAFAGAAWRL